MISSKNLLNIADEVCTSDVKEVEQEVGGTVSPSESVKSESQKTDKSYKKLKDEFFNKYILKEFFVKKIQEFKQKVNDAISGISTDSPQEDLIQSTQYISKKNKEELIQFIKNLETQVLAE